MADPVLSRAEGNVIDFASARTDRVAHQMFDITLEAADALVKGLDRFSLMMPNALSAQAMCIEAAAMGAAQVARIAGTAELERSGDVLRARARFRLAINILKNSLEAYAVDAEASLARAGLDPSSPLGTGHAS